MTNINALEELQRLLEIEKAARKAAEDKLEQKELALQNALQQIQKTETQKNSGLKKETDERLFRDVVNNLPGIVFQLQKNADGLFVFNFVSPVLHQMLGLKVSDTSQILPFIHPEDKKRWTESLENTYQNVKVWKQEIRFLMGDGTIYWWISSATPSYSVNGDLLYNGILLNITKQKEAELSLKENEKKWRFALEGSGDGLWEYDVVNNKTFYSSTFKEMLGFTEKEYGQDPNFWVKSIHPDDLHKVEEMERNYTNNATDSHSIQYRTLNKLGEYVWIMDRGFVLSRDVSGKPSHFIGVHTNINQIKQTEFELTSTAVKLATLVTNMQDGIVLEDEHNIVVLCNQSFCNIFDIPLAPKQIVGQNIEQSLLRNTHRFKDFTIYMSRRHALLKECKPAANEEIELANGKFLSRDYAPLIIEGECKGHLWKYTDITQRKKAEKNLIEAEKRYRNLIENMQVGLVEFNAAQQILYANHTFYAMCGYTKNELDGRLSELIYVNADVAKQKKGLRKKGISDAYEVEIQTKSGERKWWYVSGAPRQNDQMETIATIGACLDITGQKQLEYELRQAKDAAEQLASAKDIFLANMSHEIRTPMNAMLGMTRMMEKTDLSTQQQFYLKTISNSTSSLMVIVNDILDFSKISAGKLSLEQIGFRLQEVITTSIDMVAYGAKEKGLQLIVENGECCNNILLGDPFRLKQVFINLLTNAVKFTSSGTVSVFCKNNGMVNGKWDIAVQVKDTGRGMKEDYLKILFDKFTQEDESIARSYSGTGLGMSISKHLVELMGGKISVESIKNVGTTFTLNFNFEEGNERDLLINEGMPVDTSLLQNKHILLVEDNEMNQLVAQTVLEQNGMKVALATNGVEAVDSVNSLNFDLVLMDMQMPVMDGLQATAIIRETHKDLPIIALTANALKGERDKCLAAGMNDFLAKPFEENVLLGLLCKWLDKKEIPVTTKVFIDENIIAPVVIAKQPLYNLEQLQAISPGNSDFLKLLVKIFINDASSTIIKIIDAMKQNDFKTIKSLAHRIKPSINQMGIPFYEQILRIEELCLTEDMTGELGKLVADFEKLMDELLPALEKEA